MHDTDHRAQAGASTFFFLLQVALAWPEEDLASAAQAALEGGLVEAGPLQAFAKARGLAVTLS